MLLVPLDPAGSLSFLVYLKDRFSSLYFTFSTRLILCPCCGHVASNLFDLVVNSLYNCLVMTYFCLLSPFSCWLLVTLTFTLDQEFSLSQHAKLVTRSCYYQHRQICVITRSLFHGATVVLGHAFVTSRICHWYAFLGGPPSCVIERHDRVPRSAARPTDHISPPEYYNALSCIWKKPR